MPTAELMLLKAKKMTSQGWILHTCDEARERDEGTLLEQEKLTALWQMRAKQRG